MKKLYYYKKICVACEEVVEQGTMDTPLGPSWETIWCKNCISKMRRKVNGLIKKYGWKCYLFTPKEQRHVED